MYKIVIILILILILLYILNDRENHELFELSAGDAVANAVAGVGPVAVADTDGVSNPGDVVASTPKNTSNNMLQRISELIGSITSGVSIASSAILIVVGSIVVAPARIATSVVDGLLLAVNSNEKNNTLHPVLNNSVGTDITDEQTYNPIITRGQLVFDELTPSSTSTK